MFLFSKPDQRAVDEFLVRQAAERFSYPDIGASRGTPPARYTVDHNRIQLGTGRAAFERAVAAIQQWKMFDLPWVKLFRPNTPIGVGANVAVFISHFGFCSLNACRIVYLMEETGEIEKFGFAYGTLLNHAERGEERFSVEFHSADQSVWYDLYAFSRPAPLVRLAYPVARALQRKFARDSKTAMHNAIRSV